MGQADRYSVLSAPTVAARLVALSEAVETVTAMVEFQLSGVRLAPGSQALDEMRRGGVSAVERGA